jgi:hypothetical protein
MQPETHTTQHDTPRSAHQGARGRRPPRSSGNRRGRWRRSEAGEATRSPRGGPTRSPRSPRRDHRDRADLDEITEIGPAGRRGAAVLGAAGGRGGVAGLKGGCGERSRLGRVMQAGQRCGLETGWRRDVLQAGAPHRAARTGMVGMGPAPTRVMGSDGGRRGRAGVVRSSQ